MCKHIRVSDDGLWTYGELMLAITVVGCVASRTLDLFRSGRRALRLRANERARALMSGRKIFGRHLVSTVAQRPHEDALGSRHSLDFAVADIVLRCSLCVIVKVLPVKQGHVGLKPALNARSCCQATQRI